MTLLAEIDGERVAASPKVIEAGILATLLDEEAFRAIDRERSTLDLRCHHCHQPVHLRTFPLDPHAWLFAHNPGTAELCRMMGGGGDESPAHHDTKLAIARAGAQAGFTADVEVSGEGCRADVVLSKGSVQWPIEVQLAPVSTEDVEERSRRYGVSFSNQSLWMHSNSRRWSQLVPAARFAPDDLTLITGRRVRRLQVRPNRHDAS